MNDTIPDIARALRIDLLLELLLATLLGGAIGIEREMKGKPAGLRTNILICLGAVLFTHLSLRIGGHENPDRIAASIITGVGFIGAGTILHTRGSVTGLTSAATMLVMLVLAGLARAETALGRHLTISHLTIHARPDPSPLEELQDLVGRTGLEVVHSQVRREDVDLVIDLDLTGPKRLHPQALEAVIHHPAVRSVSTGE